MARSNKCWAHKFVGDEMDMVLVGILVGLNTNCSVTKFWWIAEFLENQENQRRDICRNWRLSRSGV